MSLHVFIWQNIHRKYHQDLTYDMQFIYFSNLELEALRNTIYWLIFLSSDSNYRSFYSSRDPPAVTELGQPVYVEVFVLKHEDKDLELLLEDCWATPTNNPHDAQRWNLLVKGWIHVKLTRIFYRFCLFIYSMKTSSPVLSLTKAHLCIQMPFQWWQPQNCCAASSLQ